MPKIKHFGSLCFVSALLLSSFTFAGNNVLSLGGEEPEFLTVDEAFSFNFLQNEQGLKLSWQVTPEHYIYKGRIKFKVQGLELGTVQYPLAKPYQDEYFGEVEIYEKDFSIFVPLSKLSAASSFAVTYQGCAKAGLCYPPKRQEVSLDPRFITEKVADKQDAGGQGALEKKSQEQESGSKLSGSSSKNVVVENADNLADMSWFDKATDLQYLTQVIESQSIVVTLLLFFLLGLGLAFTPCVYPMFPILSRIIVGQGSDISTKKAFKLSFFYVQGMALTYMLLGVVAAFVGGGINATLQQPIVIVPIALLFVFLSLSMFGFYNLALPAGLQQKLNALSNNQKAGSIAGVFIMGAISGLVCSPCATAPLVAVIGFIAQSQDMLLGGTILYVLALGMGLPLLIIGTGGARLLPKAGAWMDIVKSIFGFALLSVALIFVERLVPAFYASLLWSLLAVVFVAYLYHQNQKSPLSVARTVRSIILLLALAFAAQFLHQLLFPSKQELSLRQVEVETAFIKVSSVAELEKQLQEAQKAGKRVMLDYYADWCVACKDFEHKTFSDAKVQLVFKDMILLQADVTKPSDENAALQKVFDVRALPTLVFIEKQQEMPNSRVTGFMNAERFLRHLNSLSK